MYEIIGTHITILGSTEFCVNMGKLIFVDTHDLRDPNTIRSPLVAQIVTSLLTTSGSTSTAEFREGCDRHLVIALFKVRDIMENIAVCEGFTHIICECSSFCNHILSRRT
jgi:hypothetical protein